MCTSVCVCTMSVCGWVSVCSYGSVTCVQWVHLHRFGCTIDTGECVFGLMAMCGHMCTYTCVCIMHSYVCVVSLFGYVCVSGRESVCALHIFRLDVYLWASLYGFMRAPLRMCAHRCLCLGVCASQGRGCCLCVETVCTLVLSLVPPGPASP